MMAARPQGTPQSPAQGGLESQGMQGGNGSGRRGNGDMEQVLERAPAVRIADLQKGEALMLVSTEGATDVTAIKLLAGVEPLLESPEASRNLLANWSMGSGGAGGEDSGATQ